MRRAITRARLYTRLKLQTRGTWNASYINKKVFHMCCYRTSQLKKLSNLNIKKRLAK